MHADLVKLLDLQIKDVAVAEAERRLAALSQETAALDQVLQAARDALEAARRAAADAARRQDELEARIESYRTLQERRQQRLEQVRNPKEASTLMAELDLARSVMAKEENEWVRSAETVNQLEIRTQNEERNVETIEAAQAAEREAVAQRRAQLEAERQDALRVREASAGLIEKPLRVRYDRLRKMRSGEAVVPLIGGACGGCHTSVPLNRRSQIRSGLVLDACEACGAILYPPEQDGSR